MAAWKCGWCGIHAHMAPRGEGYNVPTPEGTPLALFDEGKSVMFTTMECSACAGLSIAVTPRNIGEQNPRSLSGMTDYWRNATPARWEPQWVEGRSFDYVPGHIGRAASEAFKCHSIRAYMAAVLMARTSIEAAAKDKGVTSGTLNEKINAMAEKGLIRKSIKDAAHELRLSGNEMAHGDIQGTVDPSYSEDVLTLLTAILKELYETELLSQRIKENRSSGTHEVKEGDEAVGSGATRFGI